MSQELSARLMLAERYAKALFELAQGKKSENAVEKDFSAISIIISSSQDLRKLLGARTLKKDKLLKMLGEILSLIKANELTHKFFNLLIENKRLNILEDIARSFHRLLKEAKGELEAEVISAQALHDKEFKAINDNLESSMGKKVNLAKKVDERLIGGFIVKVGSKMFDQSIAGRLERLKIALK